MVYEADLDIPAAYPLNGHTRTDVLRRRARTTLAALCERADIRQRVEGGAVSTIVFWCGPGHAYTVDDNGASVFAIDRNGLPQKDPERSVRAIEILAYAFLDYRARESVCERGIFVYPVTPEHGRAWLAAIGRRGGAARSEAKARASRRNGAVNLHAVSMATVTNS